MADYGATENESSEMKQLAAGHVHDPIPGTLLKGESAAVRGEMLAINTASEQRLYIGDVTDGPFEAAETVTGGTSSTTGVVTIVGSGYLEVKTVTGDGFEAEETLTGGSSGATADIAASDGILDVQYKWVKFDQDISGDGRNTPRGCLANESIDASSASKDILIYTAGHFRADDLTWPDDITAAEKQAAMLTLIGQGFTVDSALA